MSKEAWAELYCMTLRCDATHQYRMSALRVQCYVNGGCTLSFFCMTCHQQSEFVIPYDLARNLARSGAPATIVPGPPEEPYAHKTIEWNDDAPPIAPLDVGIMERSTLEHFTECARRELLR